MYSLLAQAASSPATDLTSYLQSIFQQALGIDVMLAFRLLGMWVFIIWLVFALWVAIDASARYKQWQVAVLWFLFVLPFNVLGFIGYLFMRPAVTIDEHQWTKLESKYLMHELSSVNDCPNCGTLVPVSHNYCAVCGTQMNINCPKCEAIQSIYNVHCSNCGETLGENQKQVSTLQVHAHRVNILESMGQAVLKARDSIVTGMKDLKSKLVFKKKSKVPAEKEVVAQAVVVVESTKGKKK
jgi:hypothetical protein